MANDGRFTPQNAAPMASLSHAPGNAREETPLKQALALQTALHDSGLLIRDDIASSNDDETRARLLTSLASAARGWQAMQDQIRILKGKPLPGSLRPVSKPKASKSKESVAPVQEQPFKESP